MYLKTKSKTYDLRQQTLIMGILNTTPDSFSDGGSYTSMDKAIEHAVAMERAGAHVIDVGGESTRPDHEPVTETEEIARVVPVIKAIKEHISIPISIDTYKANTAMMALEAGAEMINDIWGAKKDPKMAEVAATYQVPIVLMHNRKNKQYESIIDDMIDDLQESIHIVQQAGVREEHIILDPGIGFGKELPDNFYVLQQLNRIVQAFPYPLLLGASRKSFMNTVLDIPAEERDNATGATTCFGMVQGAHIFRVHDVKRHVELVKMMDAMLKGVS